MGEPDEARAPLGSWAKSELEGTARRAAGFGSDVGLPVDLRFRTNVAKLIITRRAQLSAQNDPSCPAVFLLHPGPPQPDAAAVSERVPMLNNGMTTLNGRVWFVGATVSTGHFIDFGHCTDDDLFRFVTDTHGLGAIPAIIYDPRPVAPQIRYYPEGLVEPDINECEVLKGEEITVDRLLRVIDHVHKNCLVTPHVQSKERKLWRDPEHWRPIQTAELLIQAELRVALQGNLLTCEIRAEQPMPEGRLDLLIVERDPRQQGVWTVHAVLELKVLRSYGETGRAVSAGETRAWVKSGVKQVVAYRNSQGALAAALCCFDMRQQDTGEQCFHHVRQLADHHAVKLRRWLVYAKSEDYREALVPDF